MMSRIPIFAFALAACAAPQSNPVVAARAPSVVTPDSMDARCAEAARLRSEGYVALNALKLESARKAYLRSLELDPDNRGAMFQLDVIEALGSDRQVGTAVENDSLYNNANLSPCQKFEAQKVAAKKEKNMGPPKATQSGQIISFAKGDAHDRDMLGHNDLRMTTQAAMGDVLTCYQKGLADNPALRGDLTAKLSVEADGHVSAVLLESNTVGDAFVERCIETAFAKLQFPRRKGSTVSLNVLVPVSLETTEIDTGVKAARR